MEFLHTLAAIRTPFFDKFFSLVTQLGDETCVIVVALVMYWCYNKKTAARMLTAGLFAMLLNTLIKILVRVPRPFVLDPTLTIVEAAREGASGYSFPSGHTQLIVVLGLSVLLNVKNKAAKIGAVIITLLVMFSRMYLGVHTPTDVLAGCLFSVIIVLLIHVVLRDPAKEYHRALGMITAGIVCTAAFAAVMPLLHLELVADELNLNDAWNTLAVLLGCCTGCLLGFITEHHKAHFTEQSVWWIQLIKLVAGLALVMAIRLIVKAVLGASHPVTGLRYFLMCFTATALWPMAFPALNRLTEKK